MKNVQRTVVVSCHGNHLQPISAHQAMLDVSILLSRGWCENGHGFGNGASRLRQTRPDRLRMAGSQEGRSVKATTVTAIKPGTLHAGMSRSDVEANASP
jgi:hypothetical protein